MTTPLRNTRIGCQKVVPMSASLCTMLFDSRPYFYGNLRILRDMPLFILSLQRGIDETRGILVGNVMPTRYVCTHHDRIFA